MNIFIEKDNKSLDLDKKDISGKQLLQELNINVSTVIIVRNDEVVLEDEILNNNDKIKILSVISGG